MKNKRRTKSEWLCIFDKQQKSRLTIKDFCERHGIHLQIFRAKGAFSSLTI
jgi:predicted DNA-binding protein with PD1-like motif